MMVRRVSQTNDGPKRKQAGDDVSGLCLSWWALQDLNL